VRFPKVAKRVFLELLIAPYRQLWSGITEYHNATANAVLRVRCKQGKLIIAEDYVWLALPDFKKVHNNCRLQRSAIMGIQVHKGIGVFYNLIIHARGCKEIHADWVQPKDMTNVVKLLGQWNENMSYGTMQEVVEHYLSQGYILLSRDAHGAQLRKSLVDQSVRIAIPMPLGTTTFSAKASSNDHLVYVRSDGSLIKR